MAPQPIAVRLTTISNSIATRIVTPIFVCACFALSTAGASAATVNVTTSGADSPTCGPVLSPCATVAQAVTNSVTGDTVEIGAGTFSVGSIVIGLKNLTINGQGIGTTILDGVSVPQPATNGMFRFNGAGTSTQTISNLSFTNVSQRTGQRRFAIVATPPPSGTTLRAVNLTVTNVAIAGSGDVDTGIYSDRNAGTLSVDNLQTTNFFGNSILLERHIGPATVTNSSFTNVAASGDYGIFAMTYLLSGLAATATGAFEFTDNTFNGRAGIGINTGLTVSTPPLPFTGGITIAGNTFNSSATAGVAVSATNASTAADGGVGDILDLLITNNTFAGAASGIGVRITGRITDPTIGPGNDIRNYVTGVAVNTAAAGHMATGVDVERNQIVGNTTGVNNATTEAVDATDNWWGCNAGPGNAGCDTTGGTGTTTTDPNVILSILGVPSDPAETGTATVTAGLTTNSAGNAVSDVVADGTPLDFSAAGGSVSPVSPGMTAASADTTFTSSAGTGRSASATYDNQTVTYAFADASSPPPPPPAVPLIVPVLECIGKPLIVTDVTAFRTRVRVTGVANPSLAGKRVNIYFLPSGSSVVERATVRADGNFTGYAPLPARRVLFSNRGRYRATIGGLGSRWLKAERRLHVTTLKGQNGNLVVRGRIDPPLQRNPIVNVKVRVDCGRSFVAKRLRVNRRTGKFSSTFAAPVSENAIIVRVSGTVLGAQNRRPFRTFSIATPVVVPPAK